MENMLREGRGIEVGEQTLDIQSNLSKGTGKIMEDIKVKTNNVSGKEKPSNKDLLKLTESTKKIVSDIIAEINSDGRRTGRNFLREFVHENGILHKVVYVWFYKPKTGDILLQQRALTKNTYPGYWDVSAGGHLEKNETSKAGAKREAKEESGIIINPKKLKLIKKYRQEIKNDKIYDNEIVEVYIYPFEGSLNDLKRQEDEVLSFNFFTLEKIKNIIGDKENLDTEKLEKEKFIPKKDYYHYVINAIEKSLQQNS